MLEYAGPDRRWTRVECAPSADGLSSSVTLSSLQPLTRHAFRLLTTLRTIPTGQANPRVYRFATPLGSASKMSVARLPLLVMVYRTVSYRDKYPAYRYPQIPDGHRLSDDDITSLRAAADFNRMFYFRNSGCKLSLDMEFAVIEDALWLGQIGDTRRHDGDLALHSQAVTIVQCHRRAPSSGFQNVGPIR